MEQRHPLPPFTIKTALQKVKAAEDAWNTKDAEKVCLANTIDTEWRNRTDIINGRQGVKQFLTKKWEKELEYKLKKRLWGFRENRMAVRFEYEWHVHTGQWFRSYGNELWEFDEDGYKGKRFAGINDLPIDKVDRKFVTTSIYFFMTNDLKTQPVFHGEAVVQNLIIAEDQNLETEKVVIYDECGDTLWEEVLAQDELKKIVSIELITKST